MKKILLTLLVVAALTPISRTADAKLFEVWGSAGLGTLQGSGKFHEAAKGGALGLEVGARILILSAYIDYVRSFGGDVGANLVGFNLGGDTTFGLAGGLELVLRLAGTFYVGSLGGDEVPIHNVGAGFRGGIGLRWVFLKFFSIGITPTVGYHWFFSGGATVAGIEPETEGGWDLIALGYFRVGLGI
ncbi:MAG: hypothetical protein H6707_07870 [Deltaproteobacteria bacterium]|nr:hypothetical protein [Deltaproteobacteria bacterium]